MWIWLLMSLQCCVEIRCVGVKSPLSQSLGHCRCSINVLWTDVEKVFLFLFFEWGEMRASSTLGKKKSSHWIKKQQRLLRLGILLINIFYFGILSRALLFPWIMCRFGKKCHLMTHMYLVPWFSFSVVSHSLISFFFKLWCHFLFNLHSIFVKFVSKQIMSPFTVHEYRDCKVFVI